MILYRDVTTKEFKQLLKNDKKGSNPNYNGMHFFKYGEHAKTFLHLYGNMILACDIPDYLIEEMDYVNFYPFKDFVVGVPIPEYIIDRDNFDYAFIRDFNPSIKDNDGKIYNMFLKDMYNEWKKYNKYYFNDKYGFYDYVVNFLSDKDLDDIISNYNNGKRRIKTK